MSTPENDSNKDSNFYPLYNLHTGYSLQLEDALQFMQINLEDLSFNIEDGCLLVCSAM
jgi:hypothetical protein